MLERNAESVDIAAVLTAGSEMHPREAVQHLSQVILDATDGQLRDDATALCFDWHGGPSHLRTTNSGADSEFGRKASEPHAPQSLPARAAASSSAAASDRAASRQVDQPRCCSRRPQTNSSHTTECWPVRRRPLSLRGNRECGEPLRRTAAGRGTADARGRPREVSLFDEFASSRTRQFDVDRSRVHTNRSSEPAVGDVPNFDGVSTVGPRRRERIVARPATLVEPEILEALAVAAFGLLPRWEAAVERLCATPRNVARSQASLPVPTIWTGSRASRSAPEPPGKAQDT